jgi:hypothetical protein
MINKFKALDGQEKGLIIIGAVVLIGLYSLAMVQFLGS